MNYSPKEGDACKIIVGVCSARGMRERRDAVRETWLTKGGPGTKCVFFVGAGGPLDEEPDTIVLPCSDGYEELPEKILAFFKYCLGRFDFEWLFKCDDDTYLVQERLGDLLKSDAELVGSVELDERGAPSGGAGYLLSRRVVGLLANEPAIPLTGPEDILIGEAAIRLGTKYQATPRLCSTNQQYPTRDNETITSHWCSPGRLRTIHAMLHETPRVLQVAHISWNDRVSFYPGGCFTRHTTRCAGKWEETSEGRILLNWFEWGKELLVPCGGGEHPDRYRCMPFSAVSAEKDSNETPAEEQVGRVNAGTHAVFLTTSEYGLPHLDRFLRANPGVQVHVVCTKMAQEGEPRTKSWRNCDMPIRDWWLKQGRRLDLDYVAFFEWDVLFDSTLDAVFPGNADYYCRDLKKPGMPWDWFADIPLLPDSLQPFATGTPPMAVLRVSRRCLEAMFSHPDAEKAYGRDMQAELRFPTLASACGYEPVECPGTLQNVSPWKATVGLGPSVWHAVKERQPE